MSVEELRTLIRTGRAFVVEPQMVEEPEPPPVEEKAVDPEPAVAVDPSPAPKADRPSLKAFFGDRLFQKK